MVSSDGSQSPFPALENTPSKRLELLNLPSIDFRRLHFDLAWAYKIIYSHVGMRSDDFFIWGLPKQQGAILISCSNANICVPSGPYLLRNGSLISGIVCLVIHFLHLLHLSAQINVSISVISLIPHSSFAYWFWVFYVLSVFIIIYFFLRAAVSAVFEPCRTCHSCSSFTTLIYLCSWQINDDDDDDFLKTSLVDVYWRPDYDWYFTQNSTPAVKKQQIAWIS